SYLIDPEWQTKFSIIWASCLGTSLLFAAPRLVRSIRAGRAFTGFFGIKEDWERSGKYEVIDSRRTSTTTSKKNWTRKSYSSTSTLMRTAEGIISAMRSVALWSLPGLGLNAGQRSGNARSSIQIRVQDCDTNWIAGQHVRLRVFFSGRVFESHPLTIMNAPTNVTCLASPSSSESGRGIILGARVTGCDMSVQSRGSSFDSELGCADACTETRYVQDSVGSDGVAGLKSKIAEMDTIRAKVHLHQAEEDLLDDVRDELTANNSLVSGMIEWIADCLNISAADATYPDRGILLITLTDLMAHFVWDEVTKVDDDLRKYEARLLELDDEYFVVPPQRNIFPSVAPVFEESFSSMNSNASVFEYAPEGDAMLVDDPLPTPLQKKLQSWQDEVKQVPSTDHIYVQYKARAEKWNNTLRNIFNNNSSLDIITPVVEVIKQMKEISKQTFSSASFRRAIKDSGVTSAIEAISSPVFLIHHRNSQALQLMHMYRISDQLSEVLDRWTPSFIKSTWSTGLTHYKSEVMGRKNISTPKDFLDLFDTEENIFPGEQNISYCFFLVNLDTFRYHYDTWLGISLVNLDYNVSKFNDINSFDNFYSLIINLMSDWCKKKIPSRDGKTTVLIIDKKRFTKPLWRIVIKKTILLRDLVRESSKRATLLTQCQTCINLPPTQQCCQYIFLPHITNGLLPADRIARLQTVKEEVTGCGITMVSGEEQLRPRRPNKDQKKRRITYASDMHHPDSIGKTLPFKLQCIQRIEDIIARCGHQLLLVVDEFEDTSDPNSKIIDWASKVADFIWWNVFDEEKLAKLQEAVVESTGVSAVKRGAQFDNYSGGKMVPIGSRIGSGGRPGDTYTSYAGLEATTEKGLDILFNQAAWLVMSIQLLLGMTGVNVFNCTGYMAPIHSDDDATRGLCMQTLLKADTTNHEFGFCNVEYQYFIATTTNCLWSFNSSNLHGTMLPSKTTVLNLDSQATGSSAAGSSAAGSSAAGSLGGHSTAPAAESEVHQENGQRGRVTEESEASHRDCKTKRTVRTTKCGVATVKL
ncbi:hypothetical protein F5878DRAFT_638167, partial [Lentinula raphanica]